MWTRRLSSSLNMDLSDFTKALLAGLQDTEIRKALGDIVGEKVRQEIVLLRAEVKKKDESIAQLNRRIENLESQNDILEQYSRRNTLRVSGVSEDAGEDVIEKTLELLNETMSVSPPISLEDVDRVHRVGKRSSHAIPSGGSNGSTPRTHPRQILIKFSSYRARERVMKRRSTLKGSTIFVNEDLTRNRNAIVYKARQLKRNGKIDDVWTHDGAIIFKDKNRTIHAAHSPSKAEELMKSFLTPQN